MIFPTNFSPKNKILLADGLIIEPHKRACVRIGVGGKYYTDTITAKNYKNNEILKNWIIFHTFVLNSHYTLSEFEKNGTGNLEFIKEKLICAIDYDDVLPYVYFFQKNSAEKTVKSYQKLYATFLELKTDEIELVINYLTRLNKGTTYPNKLITDTSYWQLMIYYSIIDKLIGTQPFCDKLFYCDGCKRAGLQHHSVSPSDWRNHRLTELIPGNPDAQNAYGEIIETVNKRIRHKTVHESLIPTAKNHIETVPGETIIYDLDKTKKNYKHDPVALLSLVIQMEDVARYLLLNHLFKLNIFPIPKPLRSTTVVLGSNSQ
ncbi:MAG: hypothetical protein WC858_02510 [Parcubacteria group bacterium]